MIKLFACLALFFFCTSTVHAEIQTVTVRWTSGLCDKGCSDKVGASLRKLKGADQVTINQGSGSASIKWKKNIPFNFYDVNVAMRVVGPRIRDVRMQVSGHIVQDGKNYYLVSTGDNSRFTLLGPVQASTHQYSIQYNPAVHPLTAEMIALLQKAEKANVEVTIDGPLFEPHRAPPMYFIIENLTIPEDEKG
jgi:hypothetical protein